MAANNPILIGEVAVDFTMPSRASVAKVRLGGIVHAARGMWAAGKPYAVGVFCPTYLVDQARSYLVEHGCEEFLLLGEVTGAPNVIAIADVKEVGHQGYEDILREERRITTNYDEFDLRRFEMVVIFPGRYNMGDLLDKLSKNARVTVDVAYDTTAHDFTSTLNGRVDSVVISTSSALFTEMASSDIEPLVALSRAVEAKQLLLKENRGGSRLFDLTSGGVEHITATLDKTVNSVGVGDVYTAIFGTFNGSGAKDAAWRGMQVATVYSQTTWPDDFQRDVRRTLSLDIEVVCGLGGVSLPWHSRPDMQIYLAAPDFTYAGHKEIEVAISALEYHNFRVRRPVKENGEAKRDASPESLAPFYASDVRLLRECAAVFAIPIDRDPGTLVEVGMAIEMGKPVITFDPRNENLNTMVVTGSAGYSSDLDICLNGLFEALGKLRQGAR